MAGRGEREVKIRFTGESAVLKGAAGEVRKVFQMLQSDLNDARGAGEKLAAAQEQVAASMKADMEAISRAADVLRDSLGPEMVAAVEASGRSVEDQVQEWRKLGLTLDDITRDSDQLAAGMKALDNSARQSAGEIGDGFRKISAEADNSRSVMANFAGNAIQELPGVAGAMGPLNMAIGQFAEYATEGNIKMKNLITTGIGIGVAAIVMQGLTDKTNAMAEAQREAMRADLVKSWAEALRDAESDVGALAESVMGVGRIIGVVENAFGAVGHDLTAMFRQAKLDVYDWAEATAGGAEGAEEFAQKLRESSLSAEEQAMIMSALAYAQNAYAESAEYAADTNAVLGQKVDETTQRTIESTDAMGKSKHAVDLAKEAYDGMSVSLDRAGDAQRRLTNAQLEAIGGDIAYRAAQDSLTTAIETFNAATDDSKTGVDESRQAQDAAATAAINMAIAYQGAAEDLAAAGGAPLTAAQSHQKLIESLYQTAMSLAPDSPLRAQLVAYIQQLQTTPENVTTKLGADTTEAKTNIEDVHDSLENLDGSKSETKSTAETVDAKTQIEDLTKAIKDVPTDVTLQAKMIGVATTIADVDRVVNAMQRLIDKANEADRAVGRVAG